MSIRRWGEEVRDACVRAALEAYEDGGIRGLCAEGRFELAVDAMRAIDLQTIAAPSPRPIAPPSDASIRRLAPDDAGALFDVRMRALRMHPRSFLASEEEEAPGGVQGFAERLAQPAERAFTLGAFVGSQLVARTGVARDRMRKASHRAIVWGVFVAPEQRGTGLGRAIVQRAIEEARTMNGVETLVLSVDARNAPAYALYRSLGFVAWGVERDAFRAGGEGVDEVHMALALR